MATRDDELDPFAFLEAQLSPCQSLVYISPGGENDAFPAFDAMRWQISRASRGGGKFLLRVSGVIDGVEVAHLFSRDAPSLRALFYGLPHPALFSAVAPEGHAAHLLQLEHVVERIYALLIAGSEQDVIEGTSADMLQRITWETQVYRSEREPYQLHLSLAGRASTEHRWGALEFLMFSGEQPPTREAVRAALLSIANKHPDFLRGACEADYRYTR